MYPSSFRLRDSSQSTTKPFVLSAFLIARGTLAEASAVKKA